MSKVAGNSAFIYLGERSGKERILLANPGASRLAVASDDAAQPTLERPEGWRPEGAGETLVANSCGAPQPAVARDDVALLALKDGPDEEKPKGLQETLRSNVCCCCRRLRAISRGHMALIPHA